MKFPKEYHASDLAGQKVEFAVTAKEVAEQVLPEVDEEFVKEEEIRHYGEGHVKHKAEEEVEEQNT